MRINDDRGSNCRTRRSLPIGGNEHASAKIKLRIHQNYQKQVKIGCLVSVTSKKSPNVYKSCPKRISLVKLNILTPLQKLPTMCWWFGQNNCCPGLWKVAQNLKKSPNLVTLPVDNGKETFYRTSLWLLVSFRKTNQFYRVAIVFSCLAINLSHRLKQMLDFKTWCFFKSFDGCPLAGWKRFKKFGANLS